MKLGNCDKYYFTFQFKVQMWVWIYKIFERDQITIHHLSNKSYPNNDKPKDFWIRLNIIECQQIGEKLKLNYS